MGGRGVTKQYKHSFSLVLVLPKGFSTCILGRAAHEMLWKTEASLNRLISMAWTIEHHRFPRWRQSWKEDYQGHEGQAEQSHEVGGD